MWLLFGLVGLHSFAAGCLPVRYTEQFRPEGEIQQINVRSDAGDVELRSGEGLRIQRTVRAPEGSLDLSHNVVDGILTLGAHCKTVLPCAVDLSLEVPAGILVKVDLDQGEVWATGLESLDVKVGTGHVDVDVEGPLKVRVGHGKISARIGSKHQTNLAVGMGDVDIYARGERMALDISAALIRVNGLGHDPEAGATLQVVAPAGVVNIAGQERVAAR